MMRLKDIAEIRSGYPFRGRIESEPNGTLSVIQIKDISGDGPLSSTDLVRMNIDRDSEPYLVNLGDVLFLSRGHRLLATPITESLQNAIATYYFFVLRPKSKRVIPRYLAWYINQPPAQALLNMAKRGTHIPFVSRMDIEELHVHLPPVEVQEQIVKISDLARKETELLSAIQQKRAELIEGICLNAARRRS